MVDPQTSRFWQAARQSRLVDDAELTACWEALPPEKRGADQLDRRLARQALQAGLLTLWQAQQLLAGRSTGFKIDRYVLLNMIGQGGMGRVYLARDSRLNRQVALKILSPERVNNPRAIARFQREARVGAQLQHENLVRIYDEGEADGKCYLVMEYISGKTIGAIIAENGPLAPNTAAKLIQQIAMGLEHAQQKGLIHRDVNPYNIMVTSDGTAKLADLGLAIDLAEEESVTRDGATVGTFDYISPEQARHSHSVDTRSDIYSLGCTLYHMLTGQVPYPSPSLPEKLFGHQAVDPEPISTLAPDVPEGLIEVVRTMMRKRPDDRYATPRDVARALEPFTTESTPSSQTEGSPSPSQAWQVAPLSSHATTNSSTQITTARGENLVADAMAPSSSNLGSTSNSNSKSKSKSKSTSTPTPDLSALIPDVPKAANHKGQDTLLEGLVDFGPKRSDSPPPVAAATPSAPVPAPAPPPPPPARAVESKAAPAAELGMPELDFSRIGQESKPRKDDFSGLGLALDLGPAPGLSETPVKPRPRPAAPAVPPPSSGADASPGANAPSADSPAAPPSVPRPRRGLDRRLVAAGAVAAVAVAVTGGLWATGVLGKFAPQPPQQPAGSREPGTTSTDPAGAPQSPLAAHPDPDSPAKAGTQAKETKPQGFTVKAPDGTVTVEPDLKTAMQRAIGSRGHVLLDHREPLRLTGADAAIKINGGPLYIRAAEGSRPVLQVEIKGAKPFLTTGVQTPVTIVGVSIEAQYADHSGPGEPPPIVEAAGKVTLDRCAFKATGKTEGARAVNVLGTGLAVTGTWFTGFDQALDVAAFSGSAVTLKQCLFFKPKVADMPPDGWAVRVRNQAGGASKQGRRLTAEHCTVIGQGLFSLGGFSPQTPYKVEIKGCAVLTDALLAWQSQPAGLPLSKSALQWRGQENLYDIRGQAWVVLSPQAGIEMPGGPTNLETWKGFAEESAAVAPPLKLRSDPANLSESPSPGDFLVLGPDPPVGADPEYVGPGAKPASPKP